MSLFVKICGLRDALAIAAAVDSGADALGFVFAESPRRVSPAQAMELTRGLPAHIQRVAVTRHPAAAELDEVFAIFEPDYLQTDVEDFADIALPGTCQPLPVYREGTALRPANGTRLLFEGGDSGAGRTADWNQARKLSENNELILAGGLNADNVTEAIATVRPFGVDVSSGVEHERGKKAPKLIREFISRVREQESTVE